MAFYATGDGRHKGDTRRSKEMVSIEDMECYNLMINGQRARCWRLSEYNWASSYVEDSHKM